MSIFLKLFSQLSISNRILELIEKLERGNKSKFCQKTGIKTTTLSGIIGSRHSDPSAKLLSCVLLSYPNINARWLVTGEGPAFEENILANVVAEPSKYGKCADCMKKDAYIEKIESLLNTQEKYVTRLERQLEEESGYKVKQKTA